MLSSSEMLSKAILIATQAHDGQFDKAGVPYILHPLKVMHYTKTDDYHIMAIAVLHDTVEDSDFTLDDLRDMGFSERVVNGVDALTKRKGETLEEYKIRVFDNVDSMIVKMADLRHNSDIRRLKGITEKDTAHLQKYNLFYTELKERLNR